jgi:hypothetical protein
MSSMSKMTKGTKASPKFEMVTMTLKEYASLKPFDDQRGDSGALIKSSIVKNLKAHIKEVIQDPNLAVITKDGKVVSGNHRRVAIKETLQEGILNPEMPLSVIRLVEDYTPSELSIMAIRHNWGGNRANAVTHLLKAQTAISTKVFGPSSEAFHMNKISLGGERASKLAIRVGSVFNKYPQYFKAFVEGRAAGFTMIDLYQAKSNGDTNLGHFMDLEHPKHVKIDVRPYVDIMARTAYPGLKYIEDLRSSGLWKDKLGNNTMLEYYIMELAFNNRLVLGKAKKVAAGKISFGKFETILKRNGRKIFIAASTINADAEASYDTLNGLFFP